VRTEFADKNTVIGQFKQRKRNGYAVFKWADGGSYHGQWVDGNHEGYGMYKWPNKDEYHGQWKNDRRNGEGVFKNGANGKIKRAIWENNKEVKVLEIIKQ
jgi:hypothetical protein